MPWRLISPRKTVTFTRQSKPGGVARRCSGSWAAVTLTEVINQINTQITATSGAGNEEVQAFNNAGRLELRATPQADPGDYIQVAPIP